VAKAITQAAENICRIKACFARLEAIPEDLEPDRAESPG
jgi:hypothetical protein